MNWKQFLTEKVLKECYHETEPTSLRCIKCGTNVDYRNWRTFDNRNDLMDLYEQVYEDGKWDDFSGGARWKHTMFSVEDFADVSKWLFCLDGEGHEDRCKMVAEFYDWNEQRDPVIDKNSGAYGDN